jgi:glutathione peroxidase
LKTNFEEETQMTRKLLVMSTLMLSAVFPFSAFAKDGANCPETLNFTMRTLAGDEQVNLCDKYSGKVVLVVNTASKCGYTYQYDGLEALYRQYKDRGLVVLGFPSNDFGAQEPGNEKQIATFCRLTYGVEFPMFEKTRAAERNADPLYKTLGDLAGEYPRWNFHKYLLDRNGKLVASYSSHVEPKSPQVVHAIEKLL